MAGKVLRRAGAALLAGFFLAATAAHGQMLGDVQATANLQKPDSLLDPTSALARDNNEDAAAASDWFSAANFSLGLLAENQHMNVAQVFRPEDFRYAARGPKGLTPEGVSYIEASYISDSGDGELPSAPMPAAPASRSAPYTPITGRERVVWVVKGTLWPQHLVAGVITMGIATARDEPREDGPHWAGFGERYGVRLTSVAVNGTIEASLGSIWGEDPRYFRVPEEPFGARVKNVIKMTFLARRRDGDLAPAYARFIGVTGGNFLSNEWRPDSEADSGDALKRAAEGLAGHMVSNAWSEFWPDAKRYIFHHGQQP